MISRAEKISQDDGNIVIVLTPEEYEIFRTSCIDLLDYYEIGRSRGKKIKRLLEKLEEAKK